jgi:hypothetical protein
VDPDSSQGCFYRVLNHAKNSEMKGRAVNDKATAGAANSDEKAAAEKAAAEKAAAEKAKAAPKPHEIKDPKEWARKHWNKYGAGHHRGLSRSAMSERLAALSPYMEKNPGNEALQKHIKRLNHLLGPK